MPSVQAASSVLVTGANGFLGSHVVKSLLDRGFSARAAVRSTSKGEYLKRIFSQHAERFSYVIVPDANAPGAYDEAVKGVSSIIHVFAAMPGQFNDVAEALKPTIDGTIALLESAKKFGSEVQRFVLTSSIAAVMEHKEGPYKYTEADWNESSIVALHEKGLEVGPIWVYVASKTLQEKAAWNFFEEHKGQVGFDLVVLAPGFIVGPPIDETTTPSSSLLFIEEALKGQAPSAGFEPPEIVDVRDVAELHALSLLNDEAAGERFVVSARTFCYQDLFDIVHAISPNAVGVPKGTPGSGKTKTYEKTYDGTKSRRVFKFEYRSTEETIRDTWAAFVEKGWAQDST